MLKRKSFNLHKFLPLIFLISITTALFLSAKVTYAACGEFPDCKDGEGSSSSRSCKKYEWCIDRDSDGRCIEREWGCRCLTGGSGSTPTPPTETPLPPQPDTSPIPSPYVPCPSVMPTEFHSLRPYQASPCNQALEDIALFCGNDLIVLDPLMVTKRFDSLTDWSYIFEENPIDPSRSDAVIGCQDVCAPDMCTFSPCAACSFCPGTDCINNLDGTETCWFSIPRVKSILIDLTDAYLPIMGNTEIVVNSQIQPDEVMPDYLDDPAKVNEYISWYLNGVIGRAEYPPIDAGKDCIGRSGYAGYCIPLLSVEWFACALDPYRFNDGIGTCQWGAVSTFLINRKSKYWDEIN
jgi:hypothetical protein